MTGTTEYDAREIAKYFIYLASKNIIGDNSEREGITNLKLQKILYLAQAYYLAKLGKPLFNNKIQAWTYGPVVYDVYYHYKSEGSNAIILIDDKSNIFSEDKIVLEKIWDSFGGYSAGRLVDITHAHAPWREAYGSPSKAISNESIKEYYKSLFGC